MAHYYSGSPMGSSHRPRNGHGPYSGYDNNGRRRSSRPFLPSDRDIIEGLEADAVRTIARPIVSASTENPIKPENVEYVGSYNWEGAPHPTIIVPGSPPEWLDRQFPYRVPFDHGVRLIDQNGFRMGPFASCLLPLFRAADVVAEEHTDVSVDWSSVDVVTDRNNLRKLLRWLQNPEVPANNGAVAGSSDPSKEAGLSFVAAREAALRDFRIDFQLGGRKTVLLHRWEKRTRELAQPPRSGCGLNFEQESTRPAKGCLRSTGHHRIVTYDMGGLKLVVRCEVDACLPQPEATTSRAANGTTTLALSEPKTANDDNLANMMSELDVSSPSSPEDPASESITDINVIRAGTIVPQSDTIEVTTRSVRYIDEFDWTEQYPQLFLSYTPNIFLAVHDRGTFERMIQRKLGTSELRAVEQSPRIQRAFRQLVAVLREIQALATSFGKDARLSLVCRDGKLEVFKRTNGEGSLEEAELERFDA